MQRDGNVSVKLVEGEDYEQVQVISGMEDSPDPRVLGTRLVFDSRIDPSSARRGPEASPN